MFYGRFRCLDFQFFFVDKGYLVVQFFVDFFYGVVMYFVVLFVYVGEIVFGVFDEVFGEFVVLDVVQYVFYFGFGLVGNDVWFGYVVVEFGGVGDGVVYVFKVFFVDQVYDQFDFVQCFEVGDFGLVVGFYQCFEVCLNEVGYVVVQYVLFVEQVGFGFFFEGGFEYVCFGVVDVVCVGQCDVMCFVVGVLLYGEDVGYFCVVGVYVVQYVVGVFGGDQEYVYVGGWFDVFEVYVEVVVEGECFVGGQVGCDVFFVYGRLLFVGNQ